MIMREYDAALTQLYKTRLFMGIEQYNTPADQIKRPKGMRNREFNNRIAKIKRLEAKIEAMWEKEAKKAYERMYLVK